MKHKRVRPFLLVVMASLGIFFLLPFTCHGWVPHETTQKRRRHGRCWSEVYTTSTEYQSISDPKPPLLTTALLNISYDGTHFTGWSAANDPTVTLDQDVSTLSNVGIPYRPSRKRRRRQKQQLSKGHVRSVQGVLRTHLAKLYGDVDPSRIIVEGCSRTDKGVHAQSMVAQVYCLSVNATTTANSTTTSSIPGKRIPHPMSSTDDSTLFEPLSMDLSKLMYVLNRMLPQDVKILGVAAVPTMKTGTLPFHPTLNSVTKTYQYTFSVGPMHDPTQWRHTWHLEHASCEFLQVDKARRACQKVFVGKHDFSAFRGAPRGSDDKRRQETESTTCTLFRVDLNTSVTDFPGVTTYTITVTGDRFLYKMMRFLVGCIVAVGTERLTLEDVQQALSSGVWDKHFTCAPPHGLILKDVSFNVPLEWITCSNRISSY